MVHDVGEIYSTDPVEVVVERIIVVIGRKKRPISEHEAELGGQESKM